MLQMYHGCVVPVSTIECSGLKPIRLTITTDEQINGQNPQEKQATISNVVNDWNHILPLPAAVSLKMVMETIVKDELISKETKLLLSSIGFQREHIPKMLVSFLCHFWVKLDKLISNP